jgi:nucleoside-diphosphate-sugar epimerase
MKNFLILGSGFTGSRVAALLRADGLRVVTIRRADIDFTSPNAVDSLRSMASKDCIVLHSVPSLPGGADAALLRALEGQARRVIYLSTTGVYGAATVVDETTAVAPRNAREQARVDTEHAVATGLWESLILRPAAIYGPGRGVHVSMAEGRYTLLGEGLNYISRIHVDDLARVAYAALLSELTGSYPVADHHPCPAREIAEYCSATYGWAMPPSVNAEDVPMSRRGNRRVDGQAICQLLGVTLRFPTYREGITQAML